MNKIHIDWSEIAPLVQHVAASVEYNWIKPDLVVGLARGGLIPGVMLSHHWDVPLVSWDVSLRDHKVATPRHDINPQIAEKNCLIVDDINDSGATIQRVLESINDLSRVRIAVLYDNQASLVCADFAGTSINKELDPRWLIFPWERDS